MDLKQLKYFLTIAEEGQITSAAKKLHMAQPPLSSQLRLLEEELGVKLFERGPRNVQLTDAGKILQNRAKQIIDLSLSTISEINDFSHGVNGTLSIGTVSSSGTMLLNSKISEFHEKYPGIKFELHEGNTFAILDLLDKGIIELGVVRTPFKCQNYGCSYAAAEPMIAVMAEEYLTDFTEEHITVEELQNKPLIIYRRFEQLINETFLEKGFEPKIFCKNDDARTTLLWANAGLGIGIVPESAFPLASNNNLFFRKILSERLKTQIVLIWRKDRYLSSFGENFIECFRKTHQ